MERGRALQLWACSPALRLSLEPHPHAAGAPRLPAVPASPSPFYTLLLHSSIIRLSRMINKRDRRRQATTARSVRQTPCSKTISRPYRASRFSPHYPGRCPGLVYRAPSGLSSTLSRALPVTLLVTLSKSQGTTKSRKRRCNLPRMNAKMD